MVLIFSSPVRLGPFVGIESVSVPGNPDTDSFDSKVGPYVEEDSNEYGSICSDGPVSVEGSAFVRGDALSGKDYDVTIDGGAVVTGAISQRNSPLNLPPVDASEAAWNNNNDNIASDWQNWDWLRTFPTTNGFARLLIISSNSN